MLPDERVHRFSKQRPKLCKVETMKSSRVNNQQVERGEGENVKTSTRDMNTNTTSKMPNLNKDDRMA